MAKDYGMEFKNQFCYLRVDGKHKVSEQNITKIIDLFEALNKEQNDAEPSLCETKDDICDECGHERSSHVGGFIKGDPKGCCIRNWGVIDRCRCKQFRKKSKSAPNHSSQEVQPQGDKIVSPTEACEGVSVRQPVNTSKSKESKIAGELNKDYDVCKCGHDKIRHIEDMGCNQCQCKQFKPKFLKTKEEGTNAQ